MFWKSKKQKDIDKLEELETKYKTTLEYEHNKKLSSLSEQEKRFYLYIESNLKNNIQNWECVERTKFSMHSKIDKLFINVNGIYEKYKLTSDEKPGFQLLSIKTEYYKNLLCETYNKLQAIQKEEEEESRLMKINAIVGHLNENKTINI